MSEPTHREVVVLNAALELRPAERAAYLDEACAGDAALRQQVEDLLRADAAAEGFLEAPPAGLGAPRTVRISAPPTEKAGDKIGHYKLLQQIGEGGCGVVYMAEQEEPVRRRVALKVIKLGMDTKQVIARFDAERQALALMDHPNIAKIFDAGVTQVGARLSSAAALSQGEARASSSDRISSNKVAAAEDSHAPYLSAGRPYFVMELVRGTKITDFCDEHSLSTGDRLKLFIQVCQAIQHAHQKGIIHRDIKPSNILVTINDGVPVPKVIDFGIAKATQGRLTDQTLFTAFEQFIGTPAYMSPEQAVMTSLDIDTRSDIYSLGVLLYELLTGKTPFDQQELLAAGLDEMRRTIREKEPPRPSTRLSAMAADALTTTAKRCHTDAPKLLHAVEGDLDWIVMKCLEKDRARRYETANGVATDITRHLNCEPVVARPPSRLYEFQKTVRRHKFGFAAGAALITVLAVGGLVSTLEAIRATRSEREQSRLRTAAQQAQLQEAGLRQTAQTEAKRAEAAVTDLKMTLSATDFMQAVRLTEEDNAIDALPFLVRSLSAHPANAAALTRLTTLLTCRSWMRPMLTLKHEDKVGSAEFSPDAKRIVTVAGYEARLWDAETGQPVTDPFKHTFTVVSSLFSPDGKRLFTASRDTARIWNAQSGRPLTEPMKHSAGFNSAEFSPDGKRIVTGSLDNTFLVWDAETGKLLLEPVTQLPEPVKPSNVTTGEVVGSSGKGTVFSVNVVGYVNSRDGVTEPFSNFPVTARFSPDGKRIVTASSDKTARVWDAQSGQPLTEPMKHSAPVDWAAFSPDGKRIVTYSADSTERVWDAETGQPLVEPMKHDKAGRSGEVSRDGKRMVTVSREAARMWDAQTGQPLTEPMRHGNVVRSAHFSPDGKRIITASADSTACVWDARTARPLVEPLSTGSRVVSIQFSPDGKRIVTASRDMTARVWNAQTGQSLTEPMKHGSNVVSAQFSADGNRIATVSDDCTARVWDAQTGRPLTEPMKHDKAVRSAEFSPDGKRIVTASADNTARIWEAQTGRPLTESLKHGSFVVSAHFSPDGKRIITASWDKTARLWDAQTGRALIAPLQHSNSVNSAEFSPDGKRILTASSDHTARVWDSQTGQPLAAPIKHGDEIDVAHFSPDGTQIVTASSDCTARVWDAQSGQPLTEPMQHKAFVFSAQFSPDGKRIVTASEDKTARVWDARTGQPLTDRLTHSGIVREAQFSPDGRQIVTAARGAVTLWDVAPAQIEYPHWLLTLTEAISGQVLSQQGVLEPTKLNRLETLNQIREQLKQQPGDDDWAVWGRWFFADHATRTISPFSKITVPEYIENRIKEKTPQSLDEAEQLAADKPEVLQRISEAREALKQTKK